MTDKMYLKGWREGQESLLKALEWEIETLEKESKGKGISPLEIYDLINYYKDIIKTEGGRK